MKYLLNKEKLMKLIGKLIHETHPNFAHGKCESMDMGDSDNPEIHYFTDKDGVFAKYNLWRRELQIRRELFYKIENYFGDKAIEFVIDWFNDEFNQDAESVTF